MNGILLDCTYVDGKKVDVYVKCHLDEVLFHINVAEKNSSKFFVALLLAPKYTECIAATVMSRYTISKFRFKIKSWTYSIKQLCIFGDWVTRLRSLTIHCGNMPRKFPPKSTSFESLGVRMEFLLAIHWDSGSTWNWFFKLFEAREVFRYCFRSFS